MEKSFLRKSLTLCTISIIIKIINLINSFSVGRPKHEKVMITTNEQDVYIGDVIVITLDLNFSGKI